ncbi:MAG: ribonuclease HI [Bacteroidota bacterium]
MKHVTVYTDGSCSGNPGPGGWGVLLEYGPIEKELSGAEVHTTNNRMELRAALEALRALKEPCRVDIHTDSTYLQRAFTEGWLTNWQKRGWKTASKKPVENRDLWEALLDAVKPHEVRWIKVKGHADDERNNRVDGLAVKAMKAGVAARSATAARS